ncbi:hypothetical protein I4U23_001527 [Adineta vaga]|nr:hypothetical protein I4U23_001527 [Adineta vaga]
MSTSNNSTLTSSGYEYMNENEIDIELKCVICKQPFQIPVSLRRCHHTFCKDCIQTWFTRSHTCPICRQYAINHVRQNHRLVLTSPFVSINTQVVLDQLDHLLIRCLLCNEINIQRCHWQNHQKHCTKKSIQCPAADIKCQWIGSQDALLIHLNTCAFYQVRPLIDELKKELTSAQLIQNELKKSVHILEKKVEFLFQFINNGKLMIQYCTKSENECQYTGTNDSNRSL